MLWYGNVSNSSKEIITDNEDEYEPGAYAGGGGGGGWGVQTPFPLGYVNFVLFSCFLLVTPEVGLVDGRYPYPIM